MARGSWQQPAMLAGLLAAPDDDNEQPEFNPFLVGCERDRMANVAPYDASYLERLQG